MKIAVVSSMGIYPERLDGPSICIYHLLLEWMKELEKCDLFVGTRNVEPVKKELGRLNITVHPISKNWGWIESIDVLRRYVSSPLTILSLARVLPRSTLHVFLRIRATKPDVVLYNALTLDPLSALPFLVKLLRIPQIAVMPVYFPDELESMTSSRTIAVLGSLLYRAEMNQMDMIAASHRQLARRVSKYVRTPITVIPNVGVSLAKTHSPVGTDKFTIVYIGRISEEKGIECLVKAVSILRKTLRTKLKVKLVGGGSQSYVAHVKKLLVESNTEDVIDMVGPVDHKQLWRYYTESDAFVLASTREGVPAAMIEAMAHGKPVVAARVGGIPEFVRNGMEGLLFESGDCKQLADRLEALATDERLRTRLGRKARETANGMTWSATAKRYIALFDLVRTGARTR